MTNIRRTMILSVTLPLLAMSIVALLLGWQVRELLSKTYWVEHTQKVISETNLAQRLLIDQETGLRAYALTGDSTFLEPQIRGVKELPRTLTALHQLTSDNATQQQRLQQLEADYRSWAQESATIRDAMKANPPLWQRDVDPGFHQRMLLRKAQMDEMRQLTDAMTTEEHRLLEQREAARDERSRFLLIGGAVVLLILALLLATGVREWVRSIDRTYAEALENEREARRVAESLAEDVTAQSGQLESAFIKMRNSRDRALERISELEKGS